MLFWTGLYWITTRKWSLWHWCLFTRHATLVPVLCYSSAHSAIQFSLERNQNSNAHSNKYHIPVCNMNISLLKKVRPKWFDNNLSFKESRGFEKRERQKVASWWSLNLYFSININLILIKVSLVFLFSLLGACLFGHF